MQSLAKAVLLFLAVLVFGIGFLRPELLCWSSDTQVLGACAQAGSVRAFSLVVYLLAALIFLLCSRSIKLIFLASMLPFLFLEGVLLAHSYYLNQKFPHSTEDILWSYHPRYGWWHTPGKSVRFSSKKNRFSAEVLINSKGLRDQEHEYQKPDNYLRILLLGDSTAVGFEVRKESTIDTRLENYISNQGIDSIQVLNAGVRGWGTDQSYLFLKEEGIKYQPDLVVYLFSQNDLENNSTIHRPLRKFGKAYFVLRSKGPELKGTPVPKQFNPPDIWLMSDLDLQDQYNKERRLVATSVVPANVVVRIKRDLSYSLSYSLIRDRFKLLLGKGSGGTSRDPLDHSATTAQIELFQAILSNMKQTAESVGAEFMVMLFANGDSPELEVNQMVLEECEKQQIPCLDPTSIFFGSVQEGATFRFAQDGHWNESGHALGARLLGEFIFDKELLGAAREN